ncbi:BamA/TamA family outer membrane protein [Bradyrhizobium sediminis]|uniref:BamA/TamA family outer membrane protein n=1 Tax=Bradyrhizobium sediminis TaxID=2840469 RepID=A0A975NGP3_9BRAD|nr:BamA/TamA family outer membrane protein [Bradyrhizobium sediminis]
MRSCSGRLAACEHTGRGLAHREELLLERLGRHRPTEEIALPLFASHAGEQIGDGAVFDAFCDHRQAQLLAQADSRADNRRIVGISKQLEHERTVDLEPVEREFLQIAQAGIAGAEVVEHDTHAEFLDSQDCVEHPLLVQQQDILSHLEFEQCRRQAGDVERLHNRGCEIARLKLRRRKIDADANIVSGLLPGPRLRRLFNDVTKTESFETHGSVVPLQSQKSTLTITAAAGFGNVSESDVIGPIYRDYIRTVSLTSDYRLQDNFGGNNYLTVMGRQGLDIFGASQQDDVFSSRYGASSTFSVLGLWFTRYQTLPDAWSVKLSAAGQIASGPLFLSQQFYLGGAAFGRGYGSAEISGDNGMAGSLELRFDQKLNLGYLTGFQLYNFVDAGTAWNAGYSYNDGLALTSVGAGVRFSLGDDLRADIAVAAPLSYRASDNTTRSARVPFSLSNSLRLCPQRAQARCH